MNCSAPDTGNMEVLERVGTPEQKEQWLKPLLAGEIRSAYAMTEPNTPVRRQEHRHQRRAGRRRVGHQRREVLHLGRRRPALQDHDHHGQDQPRRAAAQAAVADPGAHRHPGVEILGPMHVFGDDDAPHGHMHIRFTNVRVPKDNMLLGEGRGFEISQLRLGPGRIHHCMRSDRRGREGAGPDGQARPLARGLRQAAGLAGRQRRDHLRARIEIEAMRLMVLKAAKAMDVLGNREARIWVHMVKAMVPERVCKIIDQAIQMHGATGVSQWTRWRACTRSSAPCAWPTAPTKCTTWWWAATRSEALAAEMILNSAVLKASYPRYEEEAKALGR
jgi:acyl-CoA dehydrogenase